jgi:putative DNA methylase
MVWDFAEVNPFAGAGDDFYGIVDGAAKVLLNCPASAVGVVKQLDATAALSGVTRPMICTDPPYYANVGYVELSDFFYMWLRRCASQITQTCLARCSLLRPELVAEGDPCARSSPDTAQKSTWLIAVFLLIM